MHNVYLIAVAAGLLSGIGHVAAASGIPGFGVMSLFGALPLFIAGVGWSWACALLAAAVGALYAHYLGPEGAGMDFAVRLAVPAILCSSLVHLRIQAPQPDGPIQVRWAPPGLIVVAAALAAGAISVWLLEHYAPQWAQLREDLIKFTQPAPDAGPAAVATAAETKRIIDALWTSLLPAFIASSALINWMLNLWCAGRILRAMNVLPRPWPDLSLMTFPPGTGLILGTALLGATWATGWMDTAATGIAGAFLLAYLLLGLAIIHNLTRGKVWRSFALSTLYVGLFILNFWLAIPVIFLGLLDSLVPLRRPPATGHGPT